MKINKLTQFLIAVCVLFTLVSATVITKIVYTPATPISVMHKVLFDDESADAFMSLCIKQGYVIKIANCSQSQDSKAWQIRHTYIIVAEKY